MGGPQDQKKHFVVVVKEISETRNSVRVLIDLAVVWCVIFGHWAVDELWV